MSKPAGRMAELAAIYAQKGTLLPALQEQMLLDMDQVPDGRRMDLIHASELSHADLCYRAVSHRILRNEKPHQPWNFRQQNIFDEGNEIHRKWQHRMRRTGRLWGQWKCRVCGDISLGLEPPATVNGRDHWWKYDEVPLHIPGRMITGHADGAIDGNVVEIKSVGTGTLRYENPRLLADNTHTVRGRQVIDIDGIWNGIRRPFAAHIRQGNMYSWMMEQLGYPFRDIIFLYEFKVNQQVREFTVKPSRSIVQEMLGKADIIAAAVRSGRPADCPHGGCSQCEETDASTSTPQEHIPGRAGQQESRRPARGAGDHGDDRRMGTPARRRSPADPSRRPPAQRRRADGAVPPGEQLAQVPADTGGDGGDRRGSRREGHAVRRSHSTGTERSPDSNRDESPGPRGYAVRRRT